MTRQPSPKYRLCTSPSGVELWYTEHRNPDGSIGGLCGPDTRVCSKSFVSPDSIVHDKAQVTDSKLTEGCRVSGESRVDRSTLITSCVRLRANVVRSRLHATTITDHSSIIDSVARYCLISGSWSIEDSALEHVEQLFGSGDMWYARLRGPQDIVYGFDHYWWVAYRAAKGVRFRFGCEELPVAKWKGQSDYLAREHHPSEAAAYAQRTKRLAAYAAAMLVTRPKKKKQKARPATKKKAKKARSR